MNAPKHILDIAAMLALSLSCGFSIGTTAAKWHRLPNSRRLALVLLFAVTVALMCVIAVRLAS